MPPIKSNTLFYGDNLTILRNFVDDESVDLIYLDPPFNSNRSYNVLFKDESGKESPAQITAFEDTWHWNETTAAIYEELVTKGEPRVSSMIGALRQFIGANQMMAYLTMMAIRLVELHRVLKPTGSLYLHCDPTASHYLKVVLDTIFGNANFRNEIIWKRTSAHSDAKRYGAVHDVIFFYSKSASKWSWDKQYMPREDTELKTHDLAYDPEGRLYRLGDMSAAGAGPARRFGDRVIEPPAGNHWRFSQENIDKLLTEGRIVFTRNGTPRYKRYLDEIPGFAVQDVWTDLQPINSGAQEALGYPTQKPLALLERIIQASSNEGDVVLDPFCGCGTTVAAAQKLGRKWIGIDITHLSIALQKYRLKDMFGLVEKKDYKVKGEPEDLPDAKQLAQDDRYQFQWWALSLIKARPLGGDRGSREGKKGSDKGIDGVITFIDDASGKAKRVIVQVKSGKVKSGDVRDLRGVIDRDEAAIGVFVTLESPTKEMEKEAASAGFYHSPGWKRDYLKIQILTIADLLNGKEVKMPPTSITFKQAKRVREGSDTDQQDLFGADREGQE